jgi:hypothetical protein
MLHLGKFGLQRLDVGLEETGLLSVICNLGLQLSYREIAELPRQAAGQATSSGLSVSGNARPKDEYSSSQQSDLTL